MKRISNLFIGLTFAAALIGCGDGTNSGGGENTGRFDAPTNLTGETAGLAAVQLSWNAVENAEYYVIHYGIGGFDGTGADQGDSGEVLSAEPTVKLTHLRLRTNGSNTQSLGLDTTYQFAVVAKGSLAEPSEMSATLEMVVLGVTSIIDDDTTDPNEIL